MYVVDLIRSQKVLNGPDGALNLAKVLMLFRKWKESRNRGVDAVTMSGVSKIVKRIYSNYCSRKNVVVLWLHGDTILNLADEFHHNRVRPVSQANHTSPEHAQMWPFERKLEVCVQLFSN